MYRAANTPQEYDYLWLQEEFTRIENFLRLMPLRTGHVEFEGRGASNGLCPLQLSRNVASVERIGVGSYLITAAGSLGELAAEYERSVFTSHKIAPSASSEAFSVDVLDVTDLTLNLVVREQVVGLGNKLEWQPYDLLAGDFVSVLVLAEEI